MRAMSQTIELPDDLADALTVEAERAGLSLPDYAARLLATPQVPAGVTTGADLVAYWRAEGLIGDGTDVPDSPALARQLRDAAQRRGE